MDEIWERAVETALDGQTDHAAVRNLTLDGAVKCVHGRLPHPSVFERFPNLQHLSLANIGVSSLEQFPRLVNLQKLVLSDNRIAGGLECLVEAGLRSLVDLDLSNNRIQYIEDLLPLAELRLVSLDLYECPVTRVKDYRARVFGLIKSLKYLDKMDAEENETPESDEEDDDEEEEEDDEEADDPGSGEVDGGDKPLRPENGHGLVAVDGVLDEDEESDADEEENEIVANGQYAHQESNGFRMVRTEEVRDDEEIEEDNSSGEEIDEEDADDDEVVEVHEVPDSDDEDDGVEYEDEEYEDGEEEDDDEDEVDNEELGVNLASGTGRFASTEGEIDGHEQGEDDADEDDNGETGEEDDQGLREEGGYGEEDAEEEEEEDDDEENGSGYLVQPVNQHRISNDELSDMEAVNDVEEEDCNAPNTQGRCYKDDEDIYDEEDVDELDNSHQVELPPSSSSKRKRSDDESGEEDNVVQHRQGKLPKNDP